MLTIEGIDGLRKLSGTTLGHSAWIDVDQAEIDRFAEVTGDHQWIHVDVERARQSPFGGTIAHGLYTLSLGPRLSYEIYEITNISHALNYGYGRVRFPAPLPTGSRLRLRSDLAAVDDVPGGVQLTVVQTFEREGTEKPVCVAESLVRVYGDG